MKKKLTLNLCAAIALCGVAIAQSSNSTNQSSQSSSQASSQGTASSSASSSSSANSQGYSSSSRSSSNHQNSNDLKNTVVHDLMIDGELDGELVKVRAVMSVSNSSGARNVNISSDLVGDKMDSAQMNRNAQAIQIYQLIRAQIEAGLNFYDPNNDTWTYALPNTNIIGADSIVFTWANRGKIPMAVSFKFIEEETGRVFITGKLEANSRIFVISALQTEIKEMNMPNGKLLNAVTKEKVRTKVQPLK